MNATFADQDSVRNAKAYDLQQKLIEKTRDQSNALWWSRNMTRTFDQDWVNKGLPSATNPFPDYKYLDYLFDFLTRKPKLIKVKDPQVRIVVKSRRTLVSWSCVAKFLHQAQTLDAQEIIFQSQQKDKGNYLIDYAKTLRRNQEPWMQEAFPLSQRLEDFAMDTMKWKNNSRILSIPEGEDQIRTMHPSVLFMDEAASQGEGEGAYDNALSSAGLIVLVSTPKPGWFQEIVEEPELPENAREIIKGVFFTETSRDIPVLWVRDDAIPERDADWQAHAEKSYKVASTYQREHRLNFLAGGGERVLRETLERRWKEIVITDSKEIPWEDMTFGAGLDYGKTHFGTWVVNGIDRQGIRYSVAEHGCTHLTPSSHTEMIKKVTLPYEEDGSRPMALAKVKRTYFDPSMSVENISNGNLFTSNIKLFMNCGIPHLRPGARGQDLLFVDELLEAWNQTPVKYRIYCPTQVRKRENTNSQWRGCPNLVWEYMNARRKENSLTRQLAVGESEELVDKDNDFFDAAKYWWMANQAPPVETTEEKWRKKAKEIKEVNPNIDLNSLIIYAQKFAAENKPKSTSWR